MCVIDMLSFYIVQTAILAKVSIFLEGLLSHLTHGAIFLLSFKLNNAVARWSNPYCHDVNSAFNECTSGALKVTESGWKHSHRDTTMPRTMFIVRSFEIIACMLDCCVCPNRGNIRTKFMRLFCEFSMYMYCTLQRRDTLF
jgi:hypothetical protein